MVNYPIFWHMVPCLLGPLVKYELCCCLKNVPVCLRVSSLFKLFTKYLRVGNHHENVVVVGSGIIVMLSVDVGCFTIVDREVHGITRTIKEAIFIHINDPSLNMTWGNTSYPTSGIKLFRTLNHFTLGDQGPLPPLIGSTHPSPKSHTGRPHPFSSNQ